MKKILYMAVAVVFVAGLPLISLGATLKSGESYSLDKADTVSDDLYAAAGNVTVAGTVQGDAVLTGGTILVSGDIGQGILAAGGNLTMVGRVAQDVRASGGNVTIAGLVVGDVVAAGGQVDISSTSEIGRDVVAAGGTITIDGHVHGKVNAVGGQVIINGLVDGDVDVKGGDVTLGARAVVNGNLNYQSPRAATIIQGAVIKGATNFKQVNTSGIAKAFAAAGFFALITKLLLLFLSAWVLHLLFQSWSNTAVVRSASHFWMNALWGFIGMIVIPAIAGILLITIVGIPLGIIALLGYIILIVLSYVLAPVIVGSFLAAWWSTRESKQPFALNQKVNWKTILLGVIVAVLLSYLPIIGGIIDGFFILVGFGVIVKGITERFKKQNTSAKVQ